MEADINFHVLYAVVGTLVLAILTNFAYDFLTRQRLDRRIEAAESQSFKEPSKATPVWDIARLSLEKYLDRNISQLRWIFFAIVIMVVVGFGVIIEGILIVYNDSERLAPAVLASASGIVTQFIGASLFVIYRSVIGQSREYIVVLERINAVGMSMQVLDSIEGDDPNVKDKVRADIALMLLKSYHRIPVEIGEQPRG